METRKLYYEDCHMQQFTATVTACQETKDGYAVQLDATAFYPVGGGQDCDTGNLGNGKVLHVREEGEQILHICDEPLEVGQTVSGSIDYDARFARMQQHTGEHIVSGLIHALFGYHNVGFHMGKDAMEVDFDGMLTDEDVARVERLANEAVWKNLTVKCWYPAPEELSQVGYRSKRELPWPVRIVQIPGYDSCACCGVHVARTGEVGIIKILSRTKFHAGVRLEMVCGDQAYTYISAALEQNRQVSQLLSVKVLETGDGAKKLLEALSQQKYRNGQLQEQIFCSIAQSYAGGDDVIHFEEGLEPGQLRNLADQIAQVCSGVAAVFSAAGEKCNYCLVSRGTDVSALGKAMTQALSGRGGGKPNAQQGTLQADRAAIEAFFQKWQGN